MSNDALNKAKSRIRGRKLRLVLPEGDDDRIQAAQRVLEEQQLAAVKMLGSAHIAPSEAQICAILAQRPQMERSLSLRLLRKPLYFAASLVAAGDADAMVAGATHPTARVIEAGLMTIGLAPGVTLPSSFFLMQWPGRSLLFADCAVNVQPSAADLAAIAIAAAASASRLLDDEPRVALLSYSTEGSGQGADANKVRDAVAILHARKLLFKFDGELQGDAALSPAVAARKLKQPSDVAGQANVLIFPDLDAGNIAYKLVQQLSGALAIGPILQGFAKPISDLSRGVTVDDIVRTSILALSMSVAD